VGTPGRIKIQSISFKMENQKKNAQFLGILYLIVIENNRGNKVSDE